MKMKRFGPFAVAALVCGSLAQPVLAQTARIAHLSHSGSIAALATEVWKDNFGNPCGHLFRAETITATSETTAVLRGKNVFFCWGKPLKDSLARARTQTTTAFFGGRQGQMVHIEREATFACACSVATRQAVGRRLKTFYPEAELIGFEGTALPVAPVQTAVPVVKKQKAKRKKSSFTLAFPCAPQPPGAMLAVAAMLAFAGAGWLLGGRNQKSNYPA
jgi:hypothetical protein